MDVPGAPSRSIDEGSHITPLLQLLTQDEFHFDEQSYEKRDVDSWQPEDYVGLGRWLLSIIDSSEVKTEKPAEITVPLLERLYILGVGPEIQRYYRRFLGMPGYREAVGAPRGRLWRHYNQWPFSRFVEHANMVYRKTGRKPVESDYDALSAEGKGPAADTIWMYAGSLDDLHELIGFPNVNNMDEDALVDWGVRVLAINGIDKFGWLIMDILSRRGRGPSYSHVIRKNNGRWLGYKSKVADRLEQKQTMYTDKIVNGELPPHYKEMDWLSLFAQGAKYLVASSCASDLSQQTLDKIARAKTANFIPALIKLKPTLSAGFIETKALTMGFYDEIWPIVNIDEHLAVSDEELEDARVRAAERRRVSRLKQKEQQKNNEVA